MIDNGILNAGSLLDSVERINLFTFDSLFLNFLLILHEFFLDLREPGLDILREMEFLRVMPWLACDSWEVEQRRIRSGVGSGLANLACKDFSFKCHL